MVWKISYKASKYSNFIYIRTIFLLKNTLWKLYRLLHYIHLSKLDFKLYMTKITLFYNNLSFYSRTTGKMNFFYQFSVSKTKFLFFHKENGKYMKVILNKSRLILMSSNDITSSLLDSYLYSFLSIYLQKQKF